MNSSINSSQLVPGKLRSRPSGGGLSVKAWIVTGQTGLLNDLGHVIQLGLRCRGDIAPGIVEHQVCGQNDLDGGGCFDPLRTDGKWIADCGNANAPVRKSNVPSKKNSL